MCEMLVGLPDVNVLGVADDPSGPLRLGSSCDWSVRGVRTAGPVAEAKARPELELVDLPSSGGGLVW